MITFTKYLAENFKISKNTCVRKRGFKLHHMDNYTFMWHKQYLTYTNAESDDDYKWKNYAYSLICIPDNPNKEICVIVHIFTIMQGSADTSGDEYVIDILGTEGVFMARDSFNVDEYYDELYVKSLSELNKYLNDEKCDNNCYKIFKKNTMYCGFDKSIDDIRKIINKRFDSKYLLDPERYKP